MKMLDPVDVFSGVTLIATPHMDDEVLACGGTLASLPQKNRIFVLYATDGTRSPVPIVSRSKMASPDLGPIRKREAIEAMGVLGLPEENIFFLDLPDGNLKNNSDRLTLQVVELMRAISPDKVLLPFRYDRHADHLALYRSTVQAPEMAGISPELFEYFVYYRYRLLPGGDIRAYINPELLFGVDTHTYASQKREALLRYKSQTTLFYGWQDRPIIPRERVEEVSRQPEIFLRFQPNLQEHAVFHHSKVWIRLAHFIEPRLKFRKDQVLTLVKLGISRNGNRAG